MTPVTVSNTVTAFDASLLPHPHPHLHFPFLANLCVAFSLQFITVFSEGPLPGPAELTFSFLYYSISDTVSG